MGVAATIGYLRQDRRVPEATSNRCVNRYVGGRHSEPTALLNELARQLHDGAKKIFRRIPRVFGRPRGQPRP